MAVRDWALARRLRVALGAFSLLLLVAVIVIVGVLRAADHALTDQSERIAPARTAASQLLTALVDQETGLRGYAITHNKSYLQPYNQGLIDQRDARARLGQLIRRGDPARVALVTVDAAVTAWQQEYAELRLRDVLSGSATTTIGFGRELFDRVRAANSTLDVTLSGEAKSAQQQIGRDRRLVVIVLGALAIAVIAALVGLQRGLRRVVVGPLRELGTQVAQVSHGSHEQEIRPSGPRDIQEMGRGVESMRLELVRTLADLDVRRRELARRAAELARSNADLEQFAYVASHDLQEPLRKVASFCQLLEQRYGDQLDERGVQYIAFAVDGAKRMQRLINDLLSFSRVGRTSEGFEPIDLRAVIGQAWEGLEAQVSASAAEVDCREGLDPGVIGDGVLLQTLFANLLGNALKYAREGQAPRIRISGQAEGEMLRVDVADNGIGIPMEYADKVFVIFQRLHGRDQYEGTGIGLALCKKIVEFHGGSISLQPSPLGGVCVSLTLPLEESPSHV